MFHATNDFNRVRCFTAVPLGGGDKARNSRDTRRFNPLSAPNCLISQKLHADCE
jgi:hypothetical protein